MRGTMKNAVGETMVNVTNKKRTRGYIVPMWYAIIMLVDFEEYKGWVVWLD